MVVDHEAQRVGDVALEREEGRAVEKVAVRHLAALKAVADLGVVLGVDGRDLDEGHDGLALVAPQVALVGERDGPDRARAVEVARLRRQDDHESNVSSSCKGGREAEREGTHVEVLEERDAVRVGEALGRRDPEVRQEALDVQEHRMAGLCGRPSRTRSASPLKRRGGPSEMSAYAPC